MVVKNGRWPNITPDWRGNTYSLDSKTKTLVELVGGTVVSRLRLLDMRELMLACAGCAMCLVHDCEVSYWYCCAHSHTAHTLTRDR